MITDVVENWSQYFGDRLDDALEFLRKLDASSPDGEFQIRGSDLFARVFGYHTRPRDQNNMEAHRRYIDIQAVLSGAEILEWHPLEGLTALSPYSPDKDAILLGRPERPQGLTVLSPGRFAAYFPQDAHMGQIAFCAPEPIRKVVFKVALPLVQAAKS
ncbi:putative protein, YhcH/YjgK/YiaL family [Desulfocurvibacter africanus PCS]|uniref:YhcH/YjgK/YiaL family protein n=1 Tax=Desulfocurvibacter africanus PCS TaxID=1262666 RepID=M5Q076_DESAF|nr:YhcH/YjgK/YiaL family protein [Desulfocurvibacter africanus]EMG36461.1 putative protein, YhcH/YjgK/YiaL family [Desulfocurvibacter africanus PCS]